MKKLLFLLLTITTSQVFSQGGWTRPNNSHGTLQKGTGGDSAVYLPTGDGIPSGAIASYTYPIRKSNLYFDSANFRLYVYSPKTNTWDTIHVGATGGSVDWKTTGNTGTVSGTNFLGTTDSVDLIFKRNNVEVGRFGYNTTLGVTEFASTYSISSLYATHQALRITSGISPNTRYGTFDPSTITAARSWILPDASGTIALTSDIPSVSGTLNYISKFTPSGTTLGNSLLYDNGTSIGIGTTSPTGKLTIKTDNINSTQTDATGTYLTTNAATVGAQRKYSPAMVQEGFAWEDFFGGSQSHKWRTDVETNPGSFITSSNLRIQSSLAGAAYLNTFKLNQDSGLHVYSNIGTTGSVNDIKLGYLRGTSFFGTIPATGATGVGNLSIGNTTMYSMKGGSYNTAGGDFALANDTSIGFNTIYGYAGAKDNKSGYGLSGFGNNVLWKNTTGIKNAAFGGGGLESNTTGSFNYSGGHDGMYRNVSGSYNSGTGYINFSNLISGVGNTGDGYAVGGRITTGSYNFFGGYYSGGDALQKVDAVNSIVLGTNSYATEDSVVVLGADLIKKTYLKGELYASGLTTALTDTVLYYNPTSDKITYGLKPSSGGGTVTGTGTANTMTKFLTSSSIGNSSVTDDGSTVSSAIKIAITPPTDIQNTLTINENGGNKALQFGTLAASDAYGGFWAGNVTPSGSNYTFIGNNNELVFNAASNIDFRIGAGQRWQINSAGHFVTPTDNTYDIGASGATRPRTGYFGTSIGIGVSPTAALHLKAGTATANTASQKVNDGIVNTTAEAGAREMQSGFYDTKASGLRYALGGNIFDFKADSSNSGSTETDAYTYTIPANALAVDGDKISFTYTVNLTDLTSTAQIKVVAYTNTIGNTGALTVSAIGAVVISGWIIRTSSTTVRTSVNISSPGASTAIYTSENDLTGLILSSSGLLKLTLQAGGGTPSSGDLVAKMGTIQWWGTAR